jgi:membrane-bound lytic murein transglycosylase B
MKSAALFATVMCLTALLAPRAFAEDSPLDYSFVAHKLESKGADASFVRLLRDQMDETIRDRVIQTNVLGFLLKPNYSGHIDAKAIRKCRAFLKSNSRAFAQAEKEHGVPREVIASLLWVETRHGKTLGRFLVPSVYVNLAMADHPSMIQETLNELKKKVPETDPQFAALEAKVRERSATKSEWAIGELMALGEMRARHLADPFRIKGSYAGAFGMPQFVPTSYIKWAEGRDKARASDLFAARDAIYSVGNYLSQHGWGNEEPLRKQALHAYNKSDDYVSTILTLAEQVRGRPLGTSRKVASE